MKNKNYINVIYAILILMVMVFIFNFWVVANEDIPVNMELIAETEN